MKANREQCSRGIQGAVAEFFGNSRVTRIRKGGVGDE